MIEILYSSLIGFLKILPILVGAVLLSQFAKLFVNEKKIKKHIHDDGRGVIISTLIGIGTPGPLLAYLPTLKILKKKGVAISAISAFITGQTLIGPGRLLLEIRYFGGLFFLVRTGLALVIGVCVGWSFHLLNNIVKF